MARFIQRDWNRTEHDDFQLNVKDLIWSDEGATPIWGKIREGNEAEEKTVIIGWAIKPVYE